MPKLSNSTFAIICLLNCLLILICTFIGYRGLHPGQAVMQDRPSPVQYQYSSTTTSRLKLINNSGKPLYIKITSEGPSATARARVAKELVPKEAPPLSYKEKITIAGCVDKTSTGGLKICHDGSPEAIKFAFMFAGKGGKLKRAIEDWAGPIGDPEIIILDEAKGNGGYTDKKMNRIVLSADDGLLNTFCHELAHMAYHKARGGIGGGFQIYETELLAIMSELRFAKNPYGLEMLPANVSGITSWTQYFPEYCRTGSVALFILRRPTKMTVHDALYAKGSLIENLTGQNMAQFSRKFWKWYPVVALAPVPVGVTKILQYGAVHVPAGARAYYEKGITVGK